MKSERDIESDSDDTVKTPDSLLSDETKKNTPTFGKADDQDSWGSPVREEQSPGPPTKDDLELANLFYTAVMMAETPAELDEILGGQRAMITKLLDTWDSLKIPEGRKAAEEEFARMITYGAWKDTVER